MSERHLIEIRGGVIAQPGCGMAAPIDFTMDPGEQIAILGPNGGGKTRLVEVLTGRYRLRQAPAGADAAQWTGMRTDVPDGIKYIQFRDSYGTADAGYYYQQRWNQQEIDPEFTPLVRDVLERFRTGPQASAMLDRLVSLFQLEPLLDKFIITLSSGELRKLQLAKVLSSRPGILIIDNPFLGLDVGTRSDLAALLEGLIREEGLHVILVLARKAEIPPFITHVVPVEGLRVGPKQSAQRFRETDAPPVLRFRNVSIRYGERTILRDLDWTVRQGEHWILTGENGCGKSTLLSLVCADNPQAYACDIELFGRKRGTGESIWDIKKKIGYVSPEMHRSYSKDLPALNIVASGFFDTVGLTRTPSEEQLEKALSWMDTFGIRALADRSFLRLSSGEQRLCLLARAFVKEPPLLILDEPMHGLDDRTVQHVRAFLDRYFSEHPEATLLMVTHYLEESPTCIDHRLTLQKILR